MTALLLLPAAALAANEPAQVFSEQTGLLASNLRDVHGIVTNVGLMLCVVGFLGAGVLYAFGQDALRRVATVLVAIGVMSGSLSLVSFLTAEEAAPLQGHPLLHPAQG